MEFPFRPLFYVLQLSLDLVQLGTRTIPVPLNAPTPQRLRHNPDYPE